LSSNIQQYLNNQKSDISSIFPPDLLNLPLKKLTDLPVSGTDLLTSQNKVACKFITASYNIGLVLLRLEHFYSTITLGKYKIFPVRPFWWPREKTENTTNLHQ